MQVDEKSEVIDDELGLENWWMCWLLGVEEKQRRIDVVYGRAAEKVRWRVGVLRWEMQ
ncbi:predicted protein [Sclerotinia sclerotiorum 1980 UF-70]|uniref:Uncharacterized protein n=1 Tax=Sclerotinia sclerotiorum (strain ATCC 18683 / 1980 / Ss-1) TaxID=665079 RepID=A7E7R2_SCLS1|nr:predicted protein [Sclerotinia sclerotiorum 1980 UF-70]EDN96414.1 predicted protein [Sclerotinia sclerotiorum 1980 UF-70]